jgi:hypothetical protein
MSTANHPTTKSAASEVRDLLNELSRLLLNWSWEGVVGYEEMVERIAGTYGYDDTTVMLEAQSATIALGPEEHCNREA